MPSNDAIALLEADHAAARELLAMLLRMPGAGRNKERVLEVLAEDLWIHMQIEEEIFYPALGPSVGAARDDAARLATKEALSMLERCPPASPAFATLTRQLLDLHEAETLEQQSKLFERARHVLSRDVLGLLGKRLRARRQELRESGAARREWTPVEVHAAPLGT